MAGNQVREFTVRDFMRKSVVTIDPGSKVSEAVRIMVDNDVACVVVVKNGKPYGIFTEEDLLHMLVRSQTPESTLVKDSMSPTIRSVTPDQSSQEAAKAMMEKKGRLLVLEAGRVIGTVTSSDIVKVIAPDTFERLQRPYHISTPQQQIFVDTGVRRPRPPHRGLQSVRCRRSTKPSDS
jgi:CBS domain-containing protein